MIMQTILPFKLETTKDMITSHAGLALLGKFAVGLGLNKALDRSLPDPGSGAGYQANVMNYCLDHGIKYAIGDESAEEVGKWYNQRGECSENRIKELNKVQTLRWKLYGTAGKIVFHGRSVYLKVSRRLQKLVAQVRLRSWEFAQNQSRILRPVRQLDLFNKI